jgi:formylglycine-generating enzyme required for sulfatase activity
MLIGAFCCTWSAKADIATVSDVTVRQRWPWDRKVDIDYLLTAEPGQSFDVSVTASNGGQALALPGTSLSGDLYNVEQGQRRIVWDPAKTGYTNATLTRFGVTLTPTNAPLYMIVDLTKATEAEGQIEYVYDADLIGGKYGSVETNPVMGVASLVWTGVTNNTAYTTTKLVLRRVASGPYVMGSYGGYRSVTLTKGLYVGVFEVTQAQWYNVMSNSPSAHAGNNAYPVEQVSFADVRGSTVGTNWPSSHDVDGTSFLGRLRTRTGLSGFDLPTEAQWECFCRAGTSSFYYDGVSTGSGDTNVLKTLAWYADNSGGVTHAVGGKGPNAWGLYDTIGNVMEWCLDYWDGTTALSGGTDPVGMTSAANRAIRGGHCGTDAWNSCDRVRWYFTVIPETSASARLGLRLVVYLP